ncbi:tyrosine--tRNA ligase [Clostridium sp. CAG:273]|jgi:tyrosyl-tRNA synthetase|nr:tyrosine--tRNA ligase [Clostridia bacterium]CDE82676.1 tyrosine--tRNA ligase [Clostridium sp. CAG:273]
MTLYEDLQWRGLIKDVSSPELEKKLNEGGLTFYIGTDPTADSLHVGHLSSFLISKRLKDAGHNPILLVGGGTGLIGDPRPTTERPMISKENVENNFESLKAQVEKIFGFKVVNNYDWLGKINMLDFLRDYGKYFNINYMLDKDIIRRRLDEGITYTEFSYMILQATDFKYLHENYGVNMQCAGSDQWGNITAGIDLIRKTTGDEVYGFTMPLVTDSQGRKFGKSEGNALWLNKDKTSSYQLYQFFVNVEDCKVIDYLKIYTFLSKEEIEELERKNNEHPELREAHKALAREIITFLHGKEEYEKAVNLADHLFNNKFNDLSKKDIEDLFQNADIKDIETGKNVVDILVDLGAVSSKREAREFIGNGAISINGDKITNTDVIVNQDLFIEGKYLVVKRGKKNYYVGKIK